MMKKQLVALTAAVLLCQTSWLYAADYNVLEKTQMAETSVYGTVQEGSINNRLQKLDTTIYGSSQPVADMDQQTDKLFTDLYDSNATKLSLLTRVNILQWQFSGDITEDALVTRVSSLEQSLSGNSGSGSLESRVGVLEGQLFKNKKYTATSVVVPAATVVKLKTLAPISSKTNHVGDKIPLMVAEDVLIGNVMAVPKGMKITGVITKAKSSGVFGQNGKLEIQFGDVRSMDGTGIPVEIGTKAQEEYKKAAGAVGASAAGAILLGPVGLVGGFFVKGDNVVIPAGTLTYVQTKAEQTVYGLIETGTTPMLASNAGGSSGGVVVVTTSENGSDKVISNTMVPVVDTPVTPVEMLTTTTAASTAAAPVTPVGMSTTTTAASTAVAPVTPVEMPTTIVAVPTTTASVKPTVVDSVATSTTGTKSNEELKPIVVVKSNN